jgi:hypothetical protein
LSTAKVELDAISQSLVDADAFITNLMPTTVPATIPTSSVAGEVTTSTVAPTTVPAERIDILAIGDSVMLGAAPEMTKYGVTVDAQKSRPFKAALPIVNYVKSINALGSAVVIHLGTNSGTSQETIDSIVSVLSDVPLVLVLTNSVPGKNWEESNNRLIRALPERYPNVQIIDWKKYATDHPKWLYDDLTHLRPMGQRKYTALIMEALGGNDRFLDRFIATHIAFFYYWIVVFLYISNPAVAYDLNHQVECHAFETYNGFLQEHGEELKSQPAPQIAIDYYQNDPYMLNAFQYNEMNRDKQSNKEVSSMHLEVKSLYDVFYNIRADEAEHAETMKILQRDMTLKSRGWSNEDNKGE